MAEPAATKPMRFFVASMGAETNTFSPIFADLSNFRESFYYPAGAHPDQPSLCSGPHIALRELASQRSGIEVIEGTAAWSDPAGIIQQAAYEQLRDAILGELEACLPVDCVLLGQHGAMIAQHCDDCDGELLEMVRKMIGPDTLLGVSYDPHGHLTAKRVENADLIVAFKEFPHTDCTDRARELVRLADLALAGKVKPVMAVHDCRMLEVMPTSHGPMRAFVDRIKKIEAEEPKVLDISVIHGFIAADVAEQGVKTLVITDDDPALAESLAKQLGEELYALRGKTRMPMLSIDEVIELLGSRPDETSPTVVADVWDNPGGGSPGDDTLLLKALLASGQGNVALGPLWDPQAVRLCFAAGTGATIPLRLGAKSAPGCGEPLDATATIMQVVEDAKQSFVGHEVNMGDCAAVAIDGVTVVLATNRAQAFGTDLFANLGIEPQSKSVLVVKSTNHFRAAFEPIAARIVYCDTKTAVYPSDPRKTPYKKLTRKVWPVCENPFGTSG